MRLIAHFSMQLGDWKSRNAQVVDRREGFSVYVYDVDGERETMVDESEFADVNDALGFAYAFGGEPDMLLIQDDNYNDLCDWRK